MLKKLFFLFPVLFLFVFLFNGCSKSSTSGSCPYINTDTTAPAVESAYIQSYLTTNGLTATKHSSGLYYTMTTVGTGDTAVICSTVVVKYTGWLFSGFKFTEQVTASPLVLGGTILGWQKGLPLVKAGGTITLYIPPSLAYGAYQSGIIPANSYLIFSIQVVAVQ